MKTFFRATFDALRVIAVLPGLAAAQSSAPVEPLRDNSFLIEEAYNQEKGVVQHISVLTFNGSPSRWSYAFTQEWPLRGERHQLSYTVPMQSARERGSRDAGLGDVVLNYRHQLGSATGAAAAAPRASLVLPTSRKVAGQAVTKGGLEVAMPLSVALNSQIVTHWNAAISFVRHTPPGVGSRATARSHSLGMSVVWLIKPRLNLLAESVARTEEVLEPGGGRTIERSVVISPGARMGFDFASGLQLVPGIAFPIGVGSSAGENGVLLYLSFEHPFVRTSVESES